VKFTRKQILFLISYPIVHVVLSGVFLLMAISTGFMHDDENWHPTRLQEITSAVGGFMIKILWAPIFLWKRSGGFVSHHTLGEYSSIFLCGVLYSFIILMIYKKIYRR